MSDIANVINCPKFICANKYLLFCENKLPHFSRLSALKQSISLLREHGEEYTDIHIKRFI